jgi:hypothetical protein
MNLMNHTYKELRKAKLIKSSRQFSTEYVKRNANWFAHKKHNGCDFCLETALICAGSVHEQIVNGQSLQPAQLRRLIAVRAKLMGHLKPMLSFLHFD